MTAQSRIRRPRRPMHNAAVMAGWLTAKERRFVLAASARRPKSYLTMKRHSRGGNGRRLRALFDEVRAFRRRRATRYVLNGLGAQIKAILEGRPC